MRKLIQIIIVTGLFLSLTASRVHAENIAGNSAGLTISSKLAQAEAGVLDDYKKKMAITAVLKKYNSPMVSEVDSFLAACKKYQIDCYLLPSIAGLESTFGRFIYPNSYNPFGWGGGLIMFDNWNKGIDTVAQGLKDNYINHGRTNIDEIGPMYSESPTWAVRVNSLYNQFKREEEQIPLFSSTGTVQL